MLKQKIMAIVALLATVPVCIMEQDITATVFIGLFAVPLLVTKKQVIY